jgi:copper ion binding protein
MNTTTVTVMGMSCGSCASTVREEIGEIPGVRKVDVDLGSGKVIIESADPVEAMSIKNAVEEAGYQLVS